MKMSTMHLKTLREVPAEAEIPSHILLLRTGMIRKLVSGVYGFMPLGWRSVKKIEAIIREEMDATGAQEIHMSAIQPSELWEESGRWSDYGPELWRVKDRHDREFCLGPTHEEIFTDVVRSDISSHRQLPQNLYQIQTKYRDEARPRFGLMRSREFIMKDAYSFDLNEEGLDYSYRVMYDAYERIFSRCGLNYRPVEADTGAMGGSNSHEFTALAGTGESEIAYCSCCDFAATVERAQCVDAAPEEEAALPLEEVHTPGAETIEEVADFLNLPKEKTLKALLYAVLDEEGREKDYVAVFLRGDRELNLTKLVNALGIPEHAIAFANEKTLPEKIGAVGGFTGPLGLHDCQILVDSEVPHLKNLCAGAGKVDYHIKNVNYQRDYQAHKVVDLKTMKEGDPCPLCREPVALARGIEVGQVFKLGTKYSDSMGAYYKDEQQKQRPIVMGCYGIGVTRTLAAIVEQHHDEQGIIWPMAVAPYQVIVTLVSPQDSVQAQMAEDIYRQLLAKKVEVLLDDRRERPGVKFKDADLLGIPLRITVGRGAAEGRVEYQLRRNTDKEELPADQAVKKAVELVQKEG